MIMNILLLVSLLLIMIGLVVIFYQRVENSKQRKQLARYKLLTETMYDIFWILDIETNRFVYVSPSVERMRGYTVEEIMRETMDAALTEEARRIVRKSIVDESQKFINGLLNERDYFVHQVPQPCKDGSLVWTEVITHYFKDPITNKVMIHGVTRDITERQKLDEKVRFLASHDALTGVMNRGAFYEQGELWFWEAKKNQTPLVFLHFDLNHFKQLNDTYGHHFGDDVLKLFAEQLKQVFSVNHQVLIARLGGDEFSVLIANQARDMIEQQCAQFIASLKRVNQIQGHEVHIQTSIGLASLKDENALAELSIQADQALYEDKKQSRTKSAIDSNALH